MKQILYCCGCEKYVKPSLVNGRTVYPHRKDLFKLPFWRCDDCGNFVGCHHKTRKPTTPLGCIPTKAIKKLRMEIHNKYLDPLYMEYGKDRKAIYKYISDRIGKPYHTGEIKSEDEAIDIIGIIVELWEGL